MLCRHVTSCYVSSGCLLLKSKFIGSHGSVSIVRSSLLTLLVSVAELGDYAGPLLTQLDWLKAESSANRLAKCLDETLEEGKQLLLYLAQKLLLERMVFKHQRAIPKNLARQYDAQAGNQHR